MLFFCSIIFIFLQLSSGFSEYDIHFFDVNKEKTEMFVEALKDGDKYSFKVISGQKSGGIIAQARYTNLINETGWGALSVTTYNDYSDELQAYSAGLVEASVNNDLIKAYTANMYPDYCSEKTSFCKILEQYLSNNIASMITKSRNQGGYWKMVRLMLWQIKGLQDGLTGDWKKSFIKMDENYLMQLRYQVFGIFLLQIDGDLSALSEILKGSEYHAKFPGRKIIGDGSCSAFIKYIEGDIYTSHVTWTGYNSMLRIAKYYNFPYRLNFNEKLSAIVPGQNISFSSYPGLISSLDDFYITSGGLITTETTIGNYNDSLWTPLKNQSANIVLEFFRVQTANRLTKSGKDWSETFSLHNSGTYNNQWMIVNTNVMEGHKYGMPIPDGVLYVAEQIPGLIKYSDVTQYLRTSYWSSYNIPFYKEIYNKSGFDEMAAKFGDFFDYEKSPRALIFKRNASEVVDGNSLIKLMRYNDYKNDPLARCSCKPPYSAENGISARSDLNPQNGSYPFGALGYRLHGGTDMKATNLFLAKAMRFVGISSPTYDQQPVFDWKNIKSTSMNHNMQPTYWNFQPIMLPMP